MTREKYGKGYSRIGIQEKVGAVASTRVERDFKFGFFLSEQTLRRIVAECEESCSKLPSSFERRFIVRLADGSTISSEDIEDVLSLDNDGTKMISSIQISFVPGVEDEEVKNFLRIDFRDAKESSKSWHSVELIVEGESRDWAFVTAANIEERVKLAKRFSVAYWSGNRYFVQIVSLCVMLLVSTFALRFVDTVDAGGMLREQYESGVITDPVEAMIFLEDARSAARHRLPWLLPATMFGGVFAVLGIFYAASRFFRSYHFGWGGYLPLYEKRSRRLSFFLTVVVVGFVVSVVAGLVVRFF